MIADVLLRASVWLAETPALTSSSGSGEEQVSPGVIGFIVTFLVAIAAVLLILDMTRRVRRVRYREEIAQKLDAEQAAERGSTEQGDQHR